MLKKYGLPALLIVAAFVFPIVDSTLDLELIFPVIIIAIYILLALGLNIVVGFAGLLDLGFVAFYALGAYAVGDRKSTRLNSSHANISYAVFCLKKKKILNIIYFASYV